MRKPQQIVLVYSFTRISINSYGIAPRQVIYTPWTPERNELGRSSVDTFSSPFCRIMKILVFVLGLAACAFAVPMGKSTKIRGCPRHPLSLSLSFSSVPLLAEDSPSRVPREYIVVFDEGVRGADGKFTGSLPYTSQQAIASPL